MMCLLWLVICCLVWKVAYNQGRKDKWKELCEDYICIHKSVGIKFGFKEEKDKKLLTNEKIKATMKMPTKKK